MTNTSCNSALAAPVGIWQGIQFYSNYSRFFQMCDTIEGVRAVDLQNDGNNHPVNNSTKNVTVAATGIGLSKALPNFAAWFKHEYLPDSEFPERNKEDGCLNSNYLTTTNIEPQLAEITSIVTGTRPTRPGASTRTTLPARSSPTGH